jgi:hypothetical protein
MADDDWRQFPTFHHSIIPNIPIIQSSLFQNSIIPVF